MDKYGYKEPVIVRMGARGEGKVQSNMERVKKQFADMPILASALCYEATITIDSVVYKARRRYKTYTLYIEMGKGEINTGLKLKDGEWNNG